MVVRIGIKDNIWVRNVECTCSSQILKGFVPHQDAHVVSRLRKRYEIGEKLPLDEFGMGSFGLGVRNPLYPEHVVGGSSSGSAAAVASCEYQVYVVFLSGGGTKNLFCLTLFIPVYISIS